MLALLLLRASPCKCCGRAVVGWRDRSEWPRLPRCETPQREETGLLRPVNSGEKCRCVGLAYEKRRPLLPAQLWPNVTGRKRAGRRRIVKKSRADWWLRAQKVQKSREKRAKNIGMSTRRAHQAGRAIFSTPLACQGSRDRGANAPGLKTGCPVSCPTGCSFPLNSKPKPNDPQPFLPNAQTTRLWIFSSCAYCPHPSWSYLLLRTQITPLALPALSLFFRTSRQLASLALPKDHLLFRSIILPHDIRFIRPKGDSSATGT